MSAETPADPGSDAGKPWRLKLEILRFRDVQPGILDVNGGQEKPFGHKAMGALALSAWGGVSGKVPVLVRRYAGRREDRSEMRKPLWQKGFRRERATGVEPATSSLGSVKSMFHQVAGNQRKDPDCRALDRFCVFPNCPERAR